MLLATPITWLQSLPAVLPVAAPPRQPGFAGQNIIAAELLFHPRWAFEMDIRDGRGSKLARVHSISGRFRLVQPSQCPSGMFCDNSIFCRDELSQQLNDARVLGRLRLDL